MLRRLLSAWFDRLRGEPPRELAHLPVQLPLAPVRAERHRRRPSEVIERLRESLPLRETPETIAELVLSAAPLNADRELVRTLTNVADSRSAFGWSAMATAFHGPVPMRRQLDKAHELAETFLAAPLPRDSGPSAAEATVDAFAALIDKPHGANDFKADRKNRAERTAAGIGLSRRRYSKMFRLAQRLESRVQRLRAEEAKARLVLIGKAAFAPELSSEQLGGHLPTAAFVAYYAARMKLRSEFTAGKQQRPFDEASAALLRWCEADGATRWFAIAHVFPRADVVARLDDRERAHLLGRAFDTLQELADRLDRLATTGSIDLDGMVVRRGNDSSTWNTLAGAWNRARDHWIALIEGLGLDSLFDELLPGKVMRLMAADVAMWHRREGGGLHPDTLVWNKLPKPWLVLRGEARCVREQVEAACRERGIDPVGSGWSAARPRTTIAQFRPSPELVHGVVVSNPYLAQYFRKIGAFSGRPLTMPQADEPGA